MKVCIKVLGIGLMFGLSAFTTAKASLLPVQLPEVSIQLPLVSVNVSTSVAAAPGDQILISVSWDASPGSAGYAVYYKPVGSSSATRVDAGNSLSATLPLLVGLSHSIYVVAYNDDGVESEPSNIVNYTPRALTRLKLSKQPGNSMRVQFRTSPAAVCRVEYSAKMNPPTWVTLATATADANGDIVINDPLVNGRLVRFYRAVKL